MQISKSWLTIIVVIALLSALVVGGLFYSRSAKQISQLKDELTDVSQKLESAMADAKKQAEPATEEPTEEVSPSASTSTSTSTVSTTTVNATTTEGEGIIKVEKDARGGTFVSKNGGKFYELLSLPGEEFEEKVLKQTADYLYIAGQQSGLGGYILYDSSYRSLKRIDMKTGEIKEIVPRGQLEIYDISADEKYVLIADIAGHKIMARDTNTLADKKFTVDAKYGQFGDIFFSPDGKKIVYGAALGKPEGGEAGVIITIDIATGKSVIYKQTTKAGTYFTVTGWSDKGIEYSVKASG